MTTRMLWSLKIIFATFLATSRGFPSRNRKDHLDNHDAHLQQVDIMSRYMDDKSLRSFTTALEDLTNDKKCDICKVITWISQQAVTFNEDKVQTIVDDICKKFHIVDNDICDGIIKIFKSEVLTVVEKLFLSPSEVCGLIFGSSCGRVYDPYQMWNISLPPRRQKPPPPPTNARPTSQSTESLRVLQLSDIHIDRQYTIGANVQCDRPVCCRKTSGEVKEAAGQWGSIGPCDSPPWLVEDLFKHLSKNEQFDYILWTGDLTSHADWNQTRDNTLYLLHYLSQLFVKYFPDTPVYPAVGNHESIPVNSFPPPYITGYNSMSWLYDQFVVAWSHWLPESASHTIQKGGYYTVLIRPGYRLVSLNMNYCNHENWWLLLNTTDPADELQWLISVLYRSEERGEKVHIIGHIAPGLNDCLKAWSWNYYKIVNRFYDTVTSQFFGHTHTDSYELFYDEATFQHPISVAYIGPSVTTFIRMNPAYRIYTIDGFYSGSDWSVLNHETFYLNLTQANEQNITKWQKEYNAKDDYKLDSLTPKDWHNLSKRLLHDETMLAKYHRFYHKSTGQPTPCNSTCAHQYVCSLRSGRSGDPKLCANLTINFREHLLWEAQNKIC